MAQMPNPIAAPEATAAPGARTPEQVVARESAMAPRAGIAALVGAVLLIVVGLVQAPVYADYPHVYTVDALRDAAGQDLGRPGLRSAQVLFYDHHAAQLILLATGQALTAVAIGYVLVFLFNAVVARVGRIPRFSQMAAMAGAAAMAVGALGYQIALTIGAHNFATARDQGTDAAHHVVFGSFVLAMGFVGALGRLSLAGAIVIIVLAAMRVGLLPRFVGVLGAIVAALLLLGPTQTFVVQAFWMMMVGVLLLGRWPRGTPAAWKSGVSVPWPSQQEIREARQAGRPVGASDAGGPATPPAPRKKRKRRH